METQQELYAQDSKSWLELYAKLRAKFPGALARTIRKDVSRLLRGKDSVLCRAKAGRPEIRYESDWHKTIILPAKKSRAAVKI